MSIPNVDEEYKKFKQLEEEIRKRSEETKKSSLEMSQIIQEDFTKYYEDRKRLDEMELKNKEAAEKRKLLYRFKDCRYTETGLF